MKARIIQANLVMRLKSLWREKSAMFFTFAFPVILVLVFGTIFTKSEDLNFDLPVQDNATSQASLQLLDALRANESFNIIPVPAGVDPVEFTIANKHNILLVIPKDLDGQQARRFLTGEDTYSIPLTYIYDPSSTTVNTRIHLLSAITAGLGHKMTSSVPVFHLVETSIMTERYRFIEFFVPGIIAMAIMTSSLSNALSINAELRQKGILRKLATTPITRTDWLVSSMIYQVILSTVSTILILIVSYLVFDVRLHIEFWLPLIVVVEVVTFVGIGMLLTHVAKEAEAATAVGNAFLFPMMFLSGTFFPVVMMPDYLQTFARLLPLYYVNEALRASMIFSDDTQTLKLLGVLAGFGAVAFVLGTLKTRWSEGT